MTETPDSQIMKANLIARLGIELVSICLIIAITSYALDLFLSFKRAIDNIAYIALYFIDALIFRTWIIALGVSLFYLVFKRVSYNRYIFLKCLLGMFIGYIVSITVFRDEMSVTIANKELKVALTYVLSGLFSVLTIQLLIIPKWFKKRYDI